MKLLGSQEQLLVTIVGLISFLSGMVFSMVGALAPMLQREIGMPAQAIGTIMGVYMMASSISGFLGTLYLDRFDRRRGLTFSLTGVVIGLVMTGLAPNLHLLIAARILSGVFSGPSTALALAIVIDNVPVERRGRALGTVAAFGALAQIIGIPAGLVVANWFDSWRSPFFAIAAVGALLAIWVIANLPSQRKHLEGDDVDVSVRRRLNLLGELLTRPICLVAFALQLTGIVPLVAITTIMSVFLVNNLGYPQSELTTLYFVGGGVNVLISRYLGRAVDVAGPAAVALASTVLLSAAIVMGYMGMNLGLPLIAIFTVFFFTSSARMVVAQTVTLRIPKPEERAGFQSLSQSVQSFAMALSALAIPHLLGSTPDGKFTRIIPFASGVLVVTWFFPFLVYWLNALLARRDRPAPLPTIEAVPAE